MTVLPGDMFANPYIVCDSCGNRVHSHASGMNGPCWHWADFHSVCPSWGPVDGCQCLPGVHDRPGDVR